jgi:hypothetical protein
MIAILSAIWPYLASGAAVLVAAIFGWSQKKSADTTKAQAGQKVAEATVVAAQANVAVAQAQDAVAQANTVAAQTGAQAVQEKSDVQNTVTELPAGTAADQLRSDWTK